MKYNVHAGHCPDGKGASGAVGYLKESTEARKVKNEVIKLLKKQGHTVYDCTCDVKKTQSGCLAYIVSKCNAHKVDLDISIHLNAGGGTGCEVLIHSNTSKAKDEAKRIAAKVSGALGIKNRGVKLRPELYVLRNTDAPALLVECAFVDNKTDKSKWNAKKCAKAIVEGLLDETVKDEQETETKQETDENQTELKATVLKDMKAEDIIKKVGSLFTADQKRTGVLASVSLAQFILESDYGRSELAQKANNCFGMKTSLSGNNWDGSVWNGKSTYNKKTKEWNGKKYVTVTAAFRKYPDIEDSIADHSAYLIGAKNGSKLRYDGLKGCTNYKKAAQIIKDGGYATSPDYVEKLCSVIEKWDLAKYNVETGKDSSTGSASTSKTPFLVKVLVKDLTIRAGAGTKYKAVGHIKDKGTYTITEVKYNGSTPWGKLKSGKGWISLVPKYTKRL